jgi:S1-C subfamily serine protease
MTLTKAFLSGTLIAPFLIAANVFAQVSSVEGIEPIEGVAIPKTQINQPNSVKPEAINKDCQDCLDKHGQSTGQDKPELPQSSQMLGLRVSDLTDVIKNELKLRGGVRVDAVAEPAARSGIREGDVIIQIANTKVADSKAFAQVLGHLDKSLPVNVMLRRGSWMHYYLIRSSR